MSSRLQYAAVWGFYLAQRTMAIPWSEPEPTPIGLMNMGMGFSPMPTEAPANLPRELLKRQFTVPDNLCGYISGDTSRPLSCAIETQSCVYFRTAVGCCDAGPISLCTNLFTECRDYGASCGAGCRTDDQILRCTDYAEPLCNAYTFSSGLVNYNCATTKTVKSVDFISDVLYTAFPGSTLTSYIGPNFVTNSADDVLNTRTRATATGATSFPSPTDPPNAGSVAIGVGAIVGIAVGVFLLVGGIIAGIIACCLIRRRKRRRAARQPAGVLQPANPAMGQAPQGPPPQANQYAPPMQTPPAAYAPTGENATYYDPNNKGAMTDSTAPAPPYIAAAASPPLNKSVEPSVSMLDSRPTSYAVSPTSEQAPASTAGYPSPPPPMPQNLYPGPAPGQSSGERFESGGVPVEHQHGQGQQGSNVYEMGSERAAGR
ncbi:MAG: hypothetical protein M1817_004551 [Caeruleum heppii]|nr:MAG: hypothetical protein M1817_004551 [Caeruleum heppii]